MILRMERSYAEKYSSFEESHWWFRARRVILRGLLAREVEWRPGMKVLEVGVGPGLNLYALYPENCHLKGLEPDAGNAALAGQRGSVPVYVGTVEAMPAELREEKFDLITM